MKGSQKRGVRLTYPNDYSLGEDFAETFGAYVVTEVCFWKTWRQMDYPKEYPLHYEFAKRVFGIEY
jgi:hypothetical protein